MQGLIPAIEQGLFLFMEGCGRERMGFFQKLPNQRNGLVHRGGIAGAAPHVLSKAGEKFFLPVRPLLLLKTPPSVPA
ncbi:MAG: hypothetical protein NTY53_23385 [Kiritimatiellaeota bacterium]|nr:hypothetical protein [Kiritimatiellota bacterium]